MSLKTEKATSLRETLVFDDWDMDDDSFNKLLHKNTKTSLNAQNEEAEEDRREKEGQNGYQ